MHQATINFGLVKHRRFRPASNAFGYGVFTLSIPMRSRKKESDLLSKCGLGDNQNKLLSFFDKDHGEGGSDSLQWIENILQEESNERMEFLGDSVLNTTIAEYLFHRYLGESEGFLTKMRTKIVNGKMLAFLSAKVGLQKYILLSKQIEDNDGRKNSNILEDTFEAFIAAIFLDYNSFDIAKSWIIGVVEEYLDFSELVQMNNNFKDQLLKHYQQNYSYLPKFYEMDVKMVNNAKIYTMCVKDTDDKVLGIGKGGSKKDAENDAARIALGF